MKTDKQGSRPGQAISSWYDSIDLANIYGKVDEQAVCVLFAVQTRAQYYHQLPAGVWTSGWILILCCWSIVFKQCKCFMELSLMDYLHVVVLVHIYGHMLHCRRTRLVADYIHVQFVHSVNPANNYLLHTPLEWKSVSSVTKPFLSAKGR